MSFLSFEFPLWFPKIDGFPKSQELLEAALHLVKVHGSSLQEFPEISF